jgi:two-component system heavy metal sensor histidine kinase CusS
VKLRNRLTLTFTIVTALALLASFVVTYFLVERDELRELDRALLVQAEHAASLALEQDASRPRIVEAPGEAIEPPSLVVRYVALYDRTGPLASATPTFDGAPRSLAELGVSPDARPTTTVELMVHGAHLRGVVLPLGDRHILFYAVSRSGVDDDLRYLLRVFSGLFVAATFLTFIVARWLGRALSRDVDAIAGVAEAVAAGDLGARVGEGAGGTVETRRLAARLDQMIDRLAELVSSQRAFISSAAHELRSPLTSLRGELELALRRERTNAEYKETIERALADAVALVSLADDLLALARVEERPRAGRRQAAHVRDLLDDARHMARGNADARRVTVVVAAPAADMIVGCPRQDGARALRNLLDNAIAHTPEGGEVALAVSRTNGTVKIAVEDKGPGVRPTDEGLIFSPFFRGEGERAAEGAGAGLGLSLAREIARAHGGDVALDKAYTSGARFVLSLPLSEAPPRD